MRDLRLDNDGDLWLDASVDAGFVDEVDCVKQRLQLSLGTGRGESPYFLDFGLPFAAIFGRVKPESVAAVLRAAIVAVEGVDRLDTFEWSFDAASRQFGSRFTVVVAQAATLQAELTLDGDEGADVRFVGVEYF